MAGAGFEWGIAVDDGVAGDGTGEEIVWGPLFDSIPEDLTQIFDDPSDPSDNPLFQTPGELERWLMEDNQDDGCGEKGVPDQLSVDFPDEWFSQYFLDSPARDLDRVRSDSQVVNDAGPSNPNCSSPPPTTSEDDNGRDKNSVRPRSDDDNNGNPIDPISKEQQRRSRNREAAARSRERRKLYVRTLEAKCAYYEQKCRRQGELIERLSAENQSSFTPSIAGSQGL